MPLNKDIKRVLVIGSGPIVIGQAAEFDYAGTQACRALKEEGLEVPAIGCGGGAVRKDYVETMDMTVYGVEAYHTPKLADAILNDNKNWEDLRKEYSDIVGEFVSEYAS